MILSKFYINKVLICILTLIFSSSAIVAQTKPYFVSNQHVSVTTQHNDNSRAGSNNSETELTTTNVNTNTFGLLFTLDVDDQTYSQPLVVSDVSIDSGVHNVVYFATVNNSIYAYDGDNGTLYWNKNYTLSGMRPPNAKDIKDVGGLCNANYMDFSGNMGIVGTPVIDNATKIIYFVARSSDGTSNHQFLHAVNITNGMDVKTPVEIKATYAGTGDGSVNGIITFDPLKQNQRASLVLSNGIVYISWSSHCDWGPYHGWVMGYNASTLQQQIVYNDTPNGADGGIWGSGQGLAADDAGNIYISVGNGTVNHGTNGKDYGESAVKLTPSGNTLTVASYFTPYNYVTLNNNDADFGSIGSLLIPHSNYYLTGDKNGSLYLLNKDNMGGMNTTSNVVNQELNLKTAGSEEHCQLAYFNNGTSEHIYIWAENDKLRSYPYASGKMGTPVLSSVAGPTGSSGAVLSVSSNAGANGVLWASFAFTGDAEHYVSPGILRAFDANDVTRELWNSNMNAGDNVGKYAKFSSPTIANGHVYLGTFSKSVQIYGLKTPANPSPCAVPIPHYNTGSLINSGAKDGVSINLTAGSDIVVGINPQAGATLSITVGGIQVYSGAAADFTVVNPVPTVGDKANVVGLYTDSCGTFTYTWHLTGSTFVPCLPSVQAITPYYNLNKSNNWTIASANTIPGQINIKSGDSIKFGPQPTSGSWSWSGACIANATTREITLNATSSCALTATLTYDDGCKTTTTKYVYKVILNNVALGVNKFEQGGFRIYPNPAKTFLNVDFDGDLSVSIMNASGQEIVSPHPIRKQGGVDVSLLSTGIYFLKAESNGESIVRKFIKN